MLRAYGLPPHHSLWDVQCYYPSFTMLRGPVMLKVTQLVGVQLGFESRQCDSIVRSLWHQAKSLRRNILLKNKWNFSVALQSIWEEGFAFTSLCKTYCISFSQKLE